MSCFKYCHNNLLNIFFRFPGNDLLIASFKHFSSYFFFFTPRYIFLGGKKTNKKKTLLKVPNIQEHISDYKIIRNQSSKVSFLVDTNTSVTEISVQTTNNS